MKKELKLLLLYIFFYNFSISLNNFCLNNVNGFILWMCTRLLHTRAHPLTDTIILSRFSHTAFRLYKNRIDSLAFELLYLNLEHVI